MSVISSMIVTVLVIIISLIIFIYVKYPITLPQTSQYITYSNCLDDKKKLKIISYNILAQELLKRKQIKALSLENRINSINKEITQADPDIFCLQEVTSDSLHLYIQKHYDSAYHLASIRNCSSSLMNVTAFKKERFELKNQFEFDLSKENVTGNRGILFTLLFDKETNRNITLYNVHFPWRPIYDREKAYIMLQIFSHMLELKEACVIIAGDFNSLVNSLVVRMVYYEALEKELSEEKETEAADGSFEFTKKEKGLIEELKAHMKKKKNFKERMMALLSTSRNVWGKYQMRSAYEEYRATIEKEKLFAFLRNHPEYTNYTMNFKGTIDYIFYSKSFRLLKISKLKESNDYLPNSLFPSDHMKLFAELEIQ